MMFFWEGDCLAAHLYAEDRLATRIPLAAVRIRECWIVESGDATLGAWLGITERAVVDQDAAP